MSFRTTLFTPSGRLRPRIPMGATAMSGEAGAFGAVLWNGCTVLMAVGLVLLLFGKGGRAKAAGLANLGVGVVLILLSLIGSHPFVAFSAGVTYVTAGLLSLRNSGLPDDTVMLT